MNSKTKCFWERDFITCEQEAIKNVRLQLVTKNLELKQNSENRLWRLTVVSGVNDESHDNKAMLPRCCLMLNYHPCALCMQQIKMPEKRYTFPWKTWLRHGLLKS